MKVLIANRGEIAARIERAVMALGWTPLRVHTAEEAHMAPEGSIALPQPGVEGYLDVEGIVEAAVDAGADLVHPGYGFLSESAELAARCAERGLRFVGPDPRVLALFGDKGEARRHAVEHDVPVLEATGPRAELADVTALFEAHRDGVMIKAVSGGGGRGMRQIHDAADLAEAYARCTSEAQRAFGDGAVYAERLLAHAKHIEVQVLGDGERVIHLGERECSLQRRHQKIIECAPSPALSPAAREQLGAWARALVEPLGYRGLATVEFLVETTALADGRLDAVFIEVNPRLQVEHTVTEEVTGVDLVQAQLRVAAGESLAAIGLDADVAPAPGVFAIQSRVNAEHVVDGAVVATHGTVTDVDLPAGVRVDHGIAPGTRVDGTFDSLLAKVITRTEGDHAAACSEASRALDALRIEGVETNVALLRELLADPLVREGRAETAHVDRLLAEAAAQAAPDDDATGPVVSTMHGTVVAVAVAPGDRIGARTPLATLESMKMEHPVSAGRSGVVREVLVTAGDQVEPGRVIAVVEPAEHAEDLEESADTIDLDHVRPDLAELLERRARTRDEARPEAVAKRHARGHRTAREMVDRLLEPDTLVEYGTLAVAAQRSRRSMDDLIANTPADGIITGLGTAASPDSSRAGVPCAVLAYDYTVLAGTQGYFNHKKTDRMLQVAREQNLPVVLFAEGGGGRPGDTDTDPLMSAGLTVTTFAAMGRLSGQVPTVGVLTGRCFAGNAALLGSCDVIIATKDSNLGMAGPAMIAGGGLGSFLPEDIGPMSVQGPNGVVDVVVEDDDEAVATVQRYLSYFTDERRDDWTAPDPRRLRHVISENRKQVYDIREVIDGLVDAGSVLELRREFGTGAVTTLVRIEGRAYGLIANNPAHLGGAIDADAADKLARFLQLCDAHGLPIVSLCDTPGFMVGPETEKTATVRHFSRLFVIGSHLQVPAVTVVLRKAYGLGAQAMAAGGFAETTATFAWPTGEIGGMGLEGAVQLGYAKELAAISDEQERQRRYDELVAEQYEAGKAINGAMVLELDDVIDPAQTRQVLVATLAGAPRTGSGRFIDTW